MRTYDIYCDILKRRYYGSDGSELANDAKPYMFFREKIQFIIHLINSSTITDVYTGLSAETITAAAAVDDDWVHYYEGALTVAKSGAVVEIKADGFTSPSIYSTGTLVLINAAGESESLNYSAYSLALGVYTFTVAETLAYSYAENDVCRLVAHPLVSIANADIDKTSKATGKLTATIDCDTLQYQSAVNGLSEIADCKFNLLIYNASSVPILSVLFAVDCLNTLIDDATTSTPSSRSLAIKEVMLTSAPAVDTDLSTIDATAGAGSWGWFEGYKYTWEDTTTVTRTSPETTW